MRALAHRAHRQGVAVGVAVVAAHGDRDRRFFVRRDRVVRCDRGVVDGVVHGLGGSFHSNTAIHILLNKRRSRRLRRIVITQRINPLSDPQQTHEGRSTIATARNLAGRRFLKQRIKTAAFVDCLDDPVRLVAGREEGRIGGVSLGITRDFGVDGQDFVFPQRQESPVFGRQVDLRTGQRDQNLAFEHRVSDFQFAHGAVFALGEDFSLNGGNASDGGIGSHAGTSRRKN